MNRAGVGGGTAVCGAQCVRFWASPIHGALSRSLVIYDRAVTAVCCLANVRPANAARRSIAGLRGGAR